MALTEQQKKDAEEKGRAKAREEHGRTGSPPKTPPSKTDSWWESVVRPADGGLSDEEVKEAVKKAKDGYEDEWRELEKGPRANPSDSLNTNPPGAKGGGSSV